jgi:hypothetical protein
MDGSGINLVFTEKYSEFIQRGRRLNWSGYRIRARLISEVKQNCVRTT